MPTGRSEGNCNRSITSPGQKDAFWKQSHNVHATSWKELPKMTVCQLCKLDNRLTQPGLAVRSSVRSVVRIPDAAAKTRSRNTDPHPFLALTPARSPGQIPRVQAKPTRQPTEGGLARPTKPTETSQQQQAQPAFLSAEHTEVTIGTSDIGRPVSLAPVIRSFSTSTPVKV